VEFLVWTHILQNSDALLQLLCVWLRNGIVWLRVLHLADVYHIVSAIYQQVKIERKC
jgi:hypothetical protein